MPRATALKKHGGQLEKLCAPLTAHGSRRSVRLCGGAVTQDPKHPDVQNGISFSETGFSHQCRTPIRGEFWTSVNLLQHRFCVLPQHPGSAYESQSSGTYVVRCEHCGFSTRRKNLTTTAQVYDFFHHGTNPLWAAVLEEWNCFALTNGFLCLSQLLQPVPGLATLVARRTHRAPPSNLRWRELEILPHVAIYEGNHCVFLVKYGHSFSVATVRKNDSLIERTRSLLENQSFFIGQWAHLYSAPHARGK